MKTTSAAANTWEVRMRWGDRALEAEVLDGRGRKAMSLGSEDGDTFVIGGGARVTLQWAPTGAVVTFTTGFTGTATLHGDTAAPLSALITKGAITEAGDTYTLTLAPGDALELHTGDQVITVQQTKGRVARLSPDLIALLWLFGTLAALLAWIVTTFRGMTPLNLLGK